MLRWLSAFAAAIAVAFVACGDGDGGGPTLSAPRTIDVTSADFDEGGPIPGDFGCDGQNTSPSLAWSGLPPGTASQAIIMDDPDAGHYVHWVAFDLPPDVTSLEAVGNAETLPSGGTQGENSKGDVGYTGPCPPSGTHRYVIRVYALDKLLDLKAGASRSEVETAMAGHILAVGELTGTFGR